MKLTEYFKKQTIDIKTLFGDNRHFKIPGYQRGYSWDRQNIEALWNDIVNCINSDDGQLKGHYTGMITICPTKNFQEHDESYYVIDGQQRLTTIIIFLAVLNKYQLENKIDIIDNFDNLVLDYESNFDDSECLKNLVVGNVGKTPSSIYQQKMKQARQMAEEKISNFENKQDLYDCLLSKLKFNIFLDDNEFNSNKIFETMNYRGKPLSYLELLKNKLIFLADKIPEKDKTEDLINKIIQLWSRIYKNLGCDPNTPLKDDELLKAHWIIYGYNNSKIKDKGNSYADDILNVFFSEGHYDEKSNKFIKNKNINYSCIYSYAKSLSEASDYWINVKLPIYNNPPFPIQNENEKNLLYKLSRIRKFEYLNALLLAVRMRSTNIDEDDRINLLDTFEKFIFINYFLKKRTNNDLSFCMSYAKEIFINKTNEQNKKTINKLISLITNDHTTITINKAIDWIFDKSHVEDTKKIFCNDYTKLFNGNIKYFLFEYNNYLTQTITSFSSDKPLIWNNFDKNSIEHILPQKVTAPSWKRVLQKYKDKNEVLAIINSLGNLVGLATTRKNTKLSNNGFYIKSKLNINIGDNKTYISYCLGSYAEIKISQNDVWTVKQIHDRTIELFKFLYENWLKKFIEEKKFFNYVKQNLINFHVIENDAEQKKLEDDLKKLYETESKEYINRNKTKGKPSNKNKSQPINIKEYLANKNKDLVILFNKLTDLVKQKLPDTNFRILPQYIGFQKNKTYYAELHILKNNIRIITHVPNEKHDLGNTIPEKFLWSLKYRSYINDESQLNEMLEILSQSYNKNR